MNKRTLAILVAVVIILVGIQVRLWRSFQWAEFWRTTHAVVSGTGIFYLLAAMAAIYLAYVLRAVRWSVFLKPSRATSAAELIPAQFIGFAGLALLGRPGELIRPYLIARKTNLTLSSQIAVWVSERIFDVGSVCALMGISVLAWYRHDRVIVRDVGIPILIIECVLTVSLLLMHFRPQFIPTAIMRFVRPFSPKMAHVLEVKVHTFTAGLNTIKDLASLTQILVVSMVHWLMVAFAYLLVTHAYQHLLPRHMSLADVLLVMMCSMVGSMVQLPGVGGGSQLAVINILSSSIFGLSHELALSVGMMLWLVTFFAVTPAGLIIARFERTSLLRLSSESQEQEKQAQEA